MSISTRAPACVAVLVALTAVPGRAAPMASVAGAGGAQSCTTSENPSELVREVSRKFLQDLSAHRAAYRQDSGQLRAAVNRDVLPFFDIQRAARLVLGVHWRLATP